MALQEEFELQGNWLFRYRSYIPFLIIVAGVIVNFRIELDADSIIVKQAPYDVVYMIGCLMVAFLGFGIRIFTVGYTPINTSGRNAKYQMADQLNTTGMYSVVRHPLYLGNFFMWLGPVIFIAHIWFILIFCMFYWLYYERIMFSEEQFLRKKFGTAYIQWAENVPAFIPAFKKYIRPSIPFSWKKILKKEKNGFSGIFIIFTSLDFSGKLLAGKTNYNWILFGLCFGSCMIYLVLKYLKWHTSLLNEDGR